MGSLYRLEAVFTEVVVVGFVPDGLRLDVHFEGQITSGLLAGGTVRGLDYLRFRPDGIGVLDVREVIRLGAKSVDVQIGGYLRPPAGFALPPAEVLLDPSFAWPEVDLPVYGYATYRTAVDDWADLNHTVATFSGVANPGTGRLVVEAEALVPEAVSTLTLA